MEILNTALALAAEGILVFPCVHGQKVPGKNTRGFYDASANPAVIRRWFGGGFARNLAIRTGAASRIWVLDEDQPGAVGALIADHGGVLPGTRVSRSSRGCHYWWFMPPGMPPVPCSTGKIAPGLDVKGDGGYVLCPPSLHPDGVHYEWVCDDPPVEAPQWLVDLAVSRPSRSISEQALALQRRPDDVVVRHDAYGRAALDRETAVLASAPKGCRNNQLNVSAFSLHQLVAGGVLSQGEVERRLIEACIANGLWTDDGPRQCMATIRSGMRAGLQHPRSPNGRR